MVGFGVRERRGELVLAHTTSHAARGGNVRLGDALAHLAGERFAGVDLNVDVKHPGFEARPLDDLRGAGLLERPLLSSQVTAVIDRLRMLDPHARTGISSVGKSTERQAYCGRRRGTAHGLRWG
jgi:glycerophosphoryl diester phosphodiesterase